MIKHQIAYILPLPATKALQDAASVDPATPVGESIVRNRALDTVIARIKIAYPNLFRKEDIPLTPR